MLLDVGKNVAAMLMTFFKSNQFSMLIQSHDIDYCC